MVIRKLIKKNAHAMVAISCDTVEEGEEYFEKLMKDLENGECTYEVSAIENQLATTDHMETSNLFCFKNDEQYHQFRKKLNPEGGAIPRELHLFARKKRPKYLFNVATASDVLREAINAIRGEVGLTPKKTDLTEIVSVAESMANGVNMSKQFFNQNPRAAEMCDEIDQRGEKMDAEFCVDLGNREIHYGFVNMTAREMAARQIGVLMHSGINPKDYDTSYFDPVHPDVIKHAKETGNMLIGIKFTKKEGN